MGSPAACPSDLLGRPLKASGRLVVAGKGEIHVALQDGTRCIDQEPMRNEPQDFTIMGGTGSYTGASGSGTVERSLSGGVGAETWNATLEVAGFEFDVTPPTLKGATSKTVRARKGAKRVRVTYAVSARDDVDGAIPVSCVPRSGSSFSSGRTDVVCSAADGSANTKTARFTITVRRRR
ncbi:MAG TPA: HYR domain-containing protein [Gaiellaceae bacterium]|nr:HYR domain-containing protein [Gaiellaceae bacterium]